MRLTFILDEENGHTVSVNGEGYQIKTIPASVPAKVHVVQVYTTYTEAENLDLTNEVFADPPSYVHDLVLAWQEAKDKHEEEQVDPETSSETEDEA